MDLSPTTQIFVLHWVEMGAKWGGNRSVAPIHALLHVMPDPMTAEEISETLNLARSNVSNGLKELQAWKLVKVSRQLGDRREHFTSVRDMFDFVTVVIEGRREREYAPTLAALREVAEKAETDGTPRQLRGRIRETLETMQKFDDWYRDVSRLPRAAQLSAVKLGARVAKFLPKGTSA